MCNVKVECIYVGSEKPFFCNNICHGITITSLYALFVFIVYRAFTLQLGDWGWISCCVKKAKAGMLLLSNQTVYWTH